MDEPTFFVGGGLVLLVVAVVALLAIALWLWALIDAIRNPALDPNMRIIWILVIVFTSWIGALIYLAVGRSGAAGVKKI